ncbi:hypothetical protein K469DRAFT_723756 [Zopfia rhizophila CBS 207.26]|uniref:Lysine-specific metallo-endopeptidase domain-containing protein n=1 Tax=Zopfia rhizophila CBS 207.26 TaxID=1314779 RepID=A0A6A6DEB7_9PEZI|nr:hypothetical protein K469DRAFT_723756 [Zopfia rhizophila CBS 207.26]
MFSLKYISTILSLSAFAGSAFAGIVFDSVHGTCGPNAENGGIKLLTDIVNLGKFASDKMATAQRDLKKKDPWEYYRVIATYDTFFDGTHPDGQKRFDDVQGKLAAMSQIGSTPTKIFVACDDNPFWSPSPDGSPQTVVFHDPDKKMDVKFLSSQLTCSGGNAFGKNLIGYRLDVNGVMYVFLCPGQNRGDELLENIKPAQKRILDSMTTMSTTLFHELMHAVFPAMKSDIAGGNDPEGERYGFLGSYTVRSTYANDNPDSLTMFAIAIAFDEFNWSLGVAESKEDVWNRLKRDDPDIITNLGLPQP